MRQVGRTTRTILDLVDYLVNNRNPDNITIAAGNYTAGLHIKNKALEICATLGVTTNKTIRIVTTEKQLREMGSVAQIFDDHSWYEYGNAI